jgi:predicted MFS family arabinose efflux permease
MLGMVAFGVGEMLGGFIIGQVVDRFDSKKAVLANVSIIVVMTLVTLWFIFADKFNWLAFAMCLLWGVQDGALNTHCFEVLGFQFDSNSEPYSVFNMVQAISVFSL